jgi:cytosine/adenosine deaminase-related metal-dependent hydrolase
MTRGAQQKVLIRGAAIVSMDDAVGDFAEGDVLIEGPKIKAVGRDLGDAASDGQAIVVDAPGYILIPGLIDSHRHCWETQMRRLIPDVELMQYMELMLGRLGPAYEPADMYLGTKLGAVAALDGGITCVLDYSHNMHSPEHADAVMRAWTESGARGVVASAAPLGNPGSGWRDDLLRVRDDLPSTGDGLLTLRTGYFAPWAPGLEGDNFISAEALREARDRGLGVTVDAAVGPVASQHIIDLGEAGALGPDVTWIHCTDLSDEAWRVIADTGGRVALAVTSDQQLAVGDSVAPLQKALDFGIEPSFSVDVECCLTSDLFTQMQVALNVQRMLAGRRRHSEEAEAPAAIPVRRILEYATAGGAKANGVWERCGSITPGKQADLVLIDAQAINNLPLNNAVATVVLGSESRNVEAVFVAGRPVKWAGSLIDVDLPALRQEIVGSRDRLLDKIGYDLDVVA